MTMDFARNENLRDEILPEIREMTTLTLLFDRLHTYVSIDYSRSFNTWKFHFKIDRMSLKYQS